MKEAELLLGFAAVAVIWLVMIAMDVWRRAKGLKRRTTSPMRQWFASIGILWGLAAISVWAWMASGRTLADLGFSSGEAGGWRLGLAWGLAIAFAGQQVIQLIAIRRNEETRTQVKDVVFGSGDYDQIMPRRRKDVWGYQLLAVTAGITEEVVFRAFLISLFALWMPIWLAAVAALAMFIVAHAYQGVQGLVRILPVSIVLTLCYVLSGSLWPGIFLHVAVDVLSGLMVWVILPREGYVEVQPRTEGAPA
ncbi:MAG: CPBP family intramembrane glutamic endopeptidase [Henriciella sp.]